MFWRYGFDTTSSLDTLLNRVDLNDNDGFDDQSSGGGGGGAMEDGQSSAGTGTGSGAPPTVEELLEEQELLNELKVKNPKYVMRRVVLQSLFLLPTLTLLTMVAGSSKYFRPRTRSDHCYLGVYTESMIWKPRPQKNGKTHNWK
jgi:hypothetical protein